MRNRGDNGWLVVLLVVILIVLAGRWAELPPVPLSIVVAGALAISVTSFLATYYIRRQQQPASTRLSSRSTEARLREATRSLRDASSVIAEVEAELRVRQAKLETISSEYGRIKLLIDADRATAEALRQELAEVVKDEGRRAFWLNTIMAVLIGIGIGVPGGVVAILVREHFFPR